jgi:hypothetical protein
MKDTIADIREKLIAGVYRNEEQVRLNLVSRILLKLGWNVWDPAEVYPEFIVAPNEDNTKVDIALFVDQFSPTVFIEAKAVGKIEGRLQETERQLRNYNRDNTALFSVITDGQVWRLYYCQTSGEFSTKLFKVINIREDDPDVAASLLATLLGKSQIETGKAKGEAEQYLQLNRKERVMEDALPTARRTTQNPPYPSLPECLQELVKQKGIDVTREEAAEFISISDRRPIVNEPETPRHVFPEPIATSHAPRAPTRETENDIIDAILGAYPYNRDGRWLSAKRQVELLRRAYDARLPDGRYAFPAMHGGVDREDTKIKGWNGDDRTNRMKKPHVKQGHALKADGKNLYMLAKGVTPAMIGVSQEVVDRLAAHNVIPRYDVNATGHVGPVV